MQFIRHGEPFNNVAANARAVVSSKLVLGNVIERFYLVLGGGNAIANINAIRVRLNGKVVWGDISGTNLNLLQKYITLNNTAGYLTVDFTEPTSRSIHGQLLGAYVTNAAGITDFTVETDLGAGVAPTQDWWVHLRSPLAMSPQAGFDPATLPLIRALIPTTVPVSAAGEIQADVNYGSGGNSLIKRLIIFSTILTSFRVKRDALDVYETVANALASYIELDYGRVAQANMYVWDPLMDGDQSDAYPTRRPDGTPSNYQFLFTASGAGQHQVYADVYSTLGSL
ncbi:MAG TPA: major capsid protein P2 [Steroidobacteraceae bacterium]|nr:major capsid protein P2 [Steroidobacteraceae bacterium]